jgi:site-specific DNA recombinase
VRLSAKRKRGWVATAIHGDRTRGTGILNNPLYTGRIVWNRSTWKRSASDSKQRKWQLNEAAEIITHADERLRIIPQQLWEAVKARQQSIEGITVKLRGVLRHKGRLPRHALSGLLSCQQCGGTFRRVNSREYGCASHADGGESACSNRIRLKESLAELRLLDELACEMLSLEGVALLKVRHLRKASRTPKAAPKPQAAQIAKKAAEIE